MCFASLRLVPVPEFLKRSWLAWLASDSFPVPHRWQLPQKPHGTRDSSNSQQRTARSSPTQLFPRVLWSRCLACPPALVTPGRQGLLPIQLPLLRTNWYWTLDTVDVQISISFKLLMFSESYMCIVKKMWTLQKDNTMKTESFSQPRYILMKTRPVCHFFCLPTVASYTCFFYHFIVICYFISVILKLCWIFKYLLMKTLD